MEYEHEKEMRDKEREVKEMKNDIEKLVKLLDKLRKQVKVRICFANNVSY